MANKLTTSVVKNVCNFVHRKIVAAALLVAMLAPVAGHDHGPGSWINHERLTDPLSKEWCCNLNDCREEKANIRQTRDGNYLVVDTGEVIPYKRVIWRSPGSWWRCRYLYGAKAGKTRCIIGPFPGS